MIPRRHLVLGPAGQVLVCAAAFGLGIGGSFIWPWGWAPPPPPLPDPSPRPGLVLTVGADSALVPSELVLVMGDGSRIGAVLWLRGRSGKEVWRVHGCGAGQGTVAPLDSPEDRTAWHHDDDDITARLASAICFNQRPKTTTKGGV